MRLKKVATGGGKGSSRSVRFAELPPASAPAAAMEIEETPATYVPSPATPPAARRRPPRDPHLNQLTSHLKRRLSSYEARREAATARTTAPGRRSCRRSSRG